MSKFKIKNLEFENLEIPNSGRKEEKQSKAIDLSGNIIETLNGKMKDHNKENPENKVSLSQLKKVFKSGASKTPPDTEAKNPNYWAIAWVNMFLRMLKGDKMERTAKYISNSHVIDISETWSPSEEDFDRAKKDVDENKLNYIFGNIDELYLDDYKRPNYDWV